MNASGSMDNRYFATLPAPALPLIPPPPPPLPLLLLLRLLGAAAELLASKFRGRELLETAALGLLVVLVLVLVPGAVLVQAEQARAMLVCAGVESVLWAKRIRFWAYASLKARRTFLCSTLSMYDKMDEVSINDCGLPINKRRKQWERSIQNVLCVPIFIFNAAGPWTQLHATSRNKVGDIMPRGSTGCTQHYHKQIRQRGCLLHNSPVRCQKQPPCCNRVEKNRH